MAHGAHASNQLRSIAARTGRLGQIIGISVNRLDKPCLLADAALTSSNHQIIYIYQDATVLGRSLVELFRFLLESSAASAYDVQDLLERG